MNNEEIWFTRQSVGPPASWQNGPPIRAPLQQAGGFLPQMVQCGLFRQGECQAFFGSSEPKTQQAQ